MAAKAAERCKSPEEAQLLSPKLKENTEQLTIEVTYEGSRISSSSRLKPKTAEVPEVLDETRTHLNQDHLGAVTTEKQLVKNIVVLGIAFACVFSSFSALQSLQSSLFQESALGLKALCCIYGLTVISTLYAPVFVHKVTPNWVITLSFVMVALFTSTFFYPRFYTLVPSAVLVGLTFGPLFSAQTSFIMHLVSKITCLTEEIREKVQQRFLRLFYLLYNFSRIIGNLMTALVLRYSDNVFVYMTKKLHHYDHSQSMTVSYQIHDTQMSVSLSRDVTGPSFCRNVECQNDEILRSTPNFIFLLPSNTSFVLVSIYLGLVLMGVALVATMLDKFEVYVYQDPLERSLWSRALRNMAVLLLDPNQPLLLPLVFFIGMEQGFIYATFTQMYVSCALGLEAVGYTMMCMGIMNTLGSFTVYQFAKHIKRPIIMAAGFIFQTGLLMVLWLWKPVRDDIAVFYVIAAGWGLCNAIWETLTLSFVATTYREDWHSPFSLYSLAQALGLTLAFCGSLYFCPGIQIYILAGTLLVSAAPYSCLEFRLHQQRKFQERSAML